MYADIKYTSVFKFDCRQNNLLLYWKAVGYPFNECNWLPIIGLHSFTPARLIPHRHGRYNIDKRHQMAKKKMDLVRSRFTVSEVSYRRGRHKNRANNYINTSHTATPTKNRPILGHPRKTKFCFWADVGLVDVTGVILEYPRSSSVWK